MDIPQISCSHRATFEKDNTWVPGRTWRATIVSRPTVTCCHLVQRWLVGQRTWKTYSLWVLVYFDAVCRKLLVNSHCLHPTYTPTNVLPDGQSAVKCFTQLSTCLDELFHDKLSDMVGFLHTFDGLVELERINVCSSCHLWQDIFWLSLVQA